MQVIKKHSATIIALLAVIFVFGIWFFTYSTLISDEVRSGEFGDMFGGANALFSGLAFVGLIYAILLQRQELSLQREELKATRGELAGQRKEQEKQNAFIAKQNFENTFFQMLNMLREIIEKLRFNQNGQTKRGGEKFHILQNELSNAFAPYKQFPTEETNMNNIRDEITKFWNRNKIQMSPYYRVLFSVLGLIDTSNFTDKSFYINLIRATLTDSETYILLYYCCINSSESKELKTLIEKYSILNSIPTSHFVNVNIYNEFDKGAFGTKNNPELGIQLRSLFSK